MRVDSITRHGHGNIAAHYMASCMYKYRFNVISLKQHFITLIKVLYVRSYDCFPIKFINEGIKGHEALAGLVCVLYVLCLVFNFVSVLSLLNK